MSSCSGGFFSFFPTFFFHLLLPLFCVCGKYARGYIFPLSSHLPDQHPCAHRFLVRPHRPNFVGHVLGGLCDEDHTASAVTGACCVTGCLLGAGSTTARIMSCDTSPYFWPYELRVGRVYGEGGRGETLKRAFRSNR